MKNFLKTKTALLLTAMSTVFVVLILMHGVALAQEAAKASAEVDQSAFGEILMEVVALVFSLLGLVATWLTAKGIKYFEKKTSIDVPAAYEATLAEWASKGVGLAQEKSHQQLQKLGTKLKGPEKMEVAVRFVRTMAENYGWDDIAEEKVRDYVESKLGLDRTDETKTLTDEGV